MPGTTGPDFPVFFDTTEVMPPKPEAVLGRIGSSKLRAATAEIGATLYVPDLVVEEVVHRRLRQLKERYGKLTEAAKALAPYVALGPVGPLDEAALVDQLREETRAALANVPVTIIPVTVALNEVLAVSLRRLPPFKKEENPTGFHDAVILLASLNHAKSAGFKYCAFVSADTAHTEAAVKGLAGERGVDCWLQRSTDEITETMELLSETKARSIADQIVRRATDFMNEHRGEVQRYLDEHPLKVAHLAGRASGRLVQVFGATVERLEAVPAGPPQEGADSPIIFWGDAAVDVVLDQPTFPPSPIADMEARPGTEFAGIDLTPFAFIDPFWSLRVQQRLLVPVTGRARARFDDGRYVGSPVIESLKGRREGGLSAALGGNVGLNDLNPFR